MQVFINPVTREFRLEASLKGKDTTQMIDSAFCIYRIFFNTPVALVISEEGFGGRDIKYYYKMNSSGCRSCSYEELENTDKNINFTINLDLEKLFFYYKAPVVSSCAPYLRIAPESTLRIQ